MTNHSICNRNVLATGLAVVTVSARFALNQGTAWAQSNSMESESASGGACAGRLLSGLHHRDEEMGPRQSQSQG